MVVVNAFVISFNYRFKHRIRVNMLDSLECTVKSLFSKYITLADGCFQFWHVMTMAKVSWRSIWFESPQKTAFVNIGALSALLAPKSNNNNKHLLCLDDSHNVLKLFQLFLHHQFFLTFELLQTNTNRIIINWKKKKPIEVKLFTIFNNKSRNHSLVLHIILAIIRICGLDKLVGKPVGIIEVQAVDEE